MPRPRKNDVHPYIKTLIDQHCAVDLMDLSRKTGINYTTLQNYADGRSTTQLRALLGICQHLKVTPNEFIQGMLETA